MNPLRRIAECLNVSFESFLRQIENHEALASCALHEIRRAAAKARVQFYKVKSDFDRNAKALSDLQTEKIEWVGRARQSVGDEQRALECIKRLSVVEKTIEQVAQEQVRNEKILNQLANDLRAIDEKTREFQTRREQLANQSANVDALQALGESSTDSLEEIHDIFIRWETKVLSFSPALVGKEDAITAMYLKEEETEALKTKLREVMAFDGKGH